MIRVYPIRTSRNMYRIPIYSYNDNFNRCGSENNLLQNIKKSYIHIATYNHDNPNTHHGRLYNYEDIIVNDDMFSIKISFPLLHPYKVNIYNKNNDGYTLQQILHLIKTIYKYTYDFEEETASENTFLIKKQCEKCETSFHKSLKIHKLDNFECCICNEKNDNLIVKLDCNHYFHKSCLINWIKKSNSCPLCRKNVFKCINCNNKGYTIIEYTGKIIPVELRNSLLYRNVTNGIFGIYNFDFEDLFLKSMTYNKKEKILKLEIIL